MIEGVFWDGEDEIIVFFVMFIGLVVFVVIGFFFIFGFLIVVWGVGWEFKMDIVFVVSILGSMVGDEKKDERLNLLVFDGDWFVLVCFFLVCFCFVRRENFLFLLL